MTIVATPRMPSDLPPGGIRIWHPTARSATATFEHHGRPYRRWNKRLKKFEDLPFHCGMCNKLHRVKTYHVYVDSDGFAIVSREIWDFMQKYNTAGFQMANEVANPPAQKVSVGTLSLRDVVEVS